MELIQGDSLTALQRMPAQSVDAIVTDPPYGLSRQPKMDEVLQHWLNGDDYHHSDSGFMGKGWDSFVPGPSLWAECLRVLKPGGYLLAFAGTRTQDLMGTAVRLAGFEIRDSIDWLHEGDEDLEQFLATLDPAQRQALQRLMDQGDARWAWLFGSGFPKSLNVSKAIDKAAGAGREVIGRRADGPSSWMIDQKREDRANGGTGIGFADGSGKEYDITAPATEAAHQWEGWGTALKPAHEPILVARKPLAGTVAQNVTEYGTGALNIDGCRVETSDSLGGGATHSDNAVVSQGGFDRPWMHDPEKCKAHQEKMRAKVEKSERLGRFPANLIHDGSAPVLEAFPASQGQQAPLRGHDRGRQSPNGIFGKMGPAVDHDPRQEAETSAARFFYCAKTTKGDRNEHGAIKNHHPTVKPTELMRYLCRLVTPPGGVVLDPFMGSGSTGKAAALEGLAFIGIEREPEYLAIAQARIEAQAEEEESLHATRRSGSPSWAYS